MCTKSGSHTNISSGGKLTTTGSKDSILVNVVFLKLGYSPALLSLSLHGILNSGIVQEIIIKQTISFLPGNASNT